MRKMRRLRRLAKRRLHDADQPVAGNGSVKHGKVSGLENVERQLPGGQQQSSRQRKNDHRFRQVAGL